MCGIAFAVANLSKDEAQIRLNNALKSLKDRGPDFSGTELKKVNDNYLMLGHTRLAIIDLDKRSNQPFNKYGCNLIFNGEIFNWKEIRIQLINLGYNFHTQSDTEVIAAAYREWGPNCVKKFNGFWSIILWDLNSPENIFVSRDNLGIKNLYYYRNRDIICFASEIKALQHLFAKNLNLDIESFSAEVCLGFKNNKYKTIYKDLFIFPPAHNAIISIAEKNFSLERYWDPLNKNKEQTRSEEDYLDEFEYLLEDSCRMRLNADVPISISLSGGIDSSCIALASSRVSSKKLNAFCSFFPKYEKGIQEKYYANYVAKKLEIKLNIIPIYDESIKDDYKKLAYSMEDLYTSTSQISNWNIIKAIKNKDYKIVLNGQGGDELFLGYPRHIASYLASSINPIFFLQKLINSSKNNHKSIANLLISMPYFLTRKFRKIIYLNNFKNLVSIELFNSLNRSFNPYKQEISLEKLVIDQTLGQQLHRLLRYDDKINGAFGIEGRPPFLDKRLVEFALSIPSYLRINSGWTKYIERLYLERHGLKKIAFRKDKLGFPSPSKAWTEIIYKSSIQDYENNSFEYKKLFKTKLNLRQKEIASIVISTLSELKVDIDL